MNCKHLVPLCLNKGQLGLEPSSLFSSRSSIVLSCSELHAGSAQLSPLQAHSQPQMRSCICPGGLGRARLLPKTLFSVLGSANMEALAGNSAPHGMMHEDEAQAAQTRQVGSAQTLPDIRAPLMPVSGNRAPEKRRAAQCPLPRPPAAPHEL